jgi:predicted GNAT family N-acyltransferase
MIKVKVNSAPSLMDLMHLFAQVDWARERKVADVEKMLKNGDWMVCLYEDDQLVGFARIITDGCFRGLLDDVIIDENHRGTGLGEKLMYEILQLGKPLDTLFLNAALDMEQFYEKFGFKKFGKLTMVLSK